MEVRNMNKYRHTEGFKRYYTLDYFYKQQFQTKVCKISLNGGFTCPNLDGVSGYGGCIYCSKLGSGEFAGNQQDDLVDQFHTVAKMMKQKWPQAKYIGYFQARTNTYAPVAELKDKYERILNQENVIGLAIATRADAISDDCYDYLEELATRTYLTVELGLQTIHPKTSALINRCHSLTCFEQAVKELRKRNINVVVHIINGLPHETKEMMIATTNYLNQFDIQGIKIHMLSVLTDTPLATYYQKAPFSILTKEEYIEIVCDQLERLNPEFVIHRITGDPKREDLIAPNWLLKKFVVINDIDKELKRRDTYQGIYYNNINKKNNL